MKMLNVSISLLVIFLAFTSGQDTKSSDVIMGKRVLGLFGSNEIHGNKTIGFEFTPVGSDVGDLRNHINCESRCRSRINNFKRLIRTSNNEMLACTKDKESAAQTMTQQINNLLKQIETLNSGGANAELAKCKFDLLAAKELEATCKLKVDPLVAACKAQVPEVTVLEQLITTLGDVYYMSKITKNFYEAAGVCASYGMRLAKIDSQDKLDAALAAFPSYFVGAIVAMNDLDMDGEFNHYGWLPEELTFTFDTLDSLLPGQYYDFVFGVIVNAPTNDGLIYGAYLLPSEFLLTPAPFLCEPSEPCKTAITL